MCHLNPSQPRLRESISRLCSKNPVSGRLTQEKLPSRRSRGGIRAGLLHTPPPRGSPVPFTEYLDGGDHRKLCSLGKGESAGSGGRGRGCLEKSWAGGSAAGILPSGPPSQEARPELARCDSRGRPFPGFRKGSSAARLCGPELRACDVGQRTQSFGTKVCLPGGQALWLIQHRALPRLPDSPTRRPVWRGEYCAGAFPSPGPPTNGIRSPGPCIPQPRGGRSCTRGRGREPGDDSRRGPRPPAPRARAPHALTCAARRRRPQQQQQQQQRRGQQRGAREERAARFPAGVDVHAGGARARVGRAGTHGARGTTQRGRHSFRKSWEQPPARSLCGGGSREGRLARSPTGGRARPWPAGRPGPRSARSPWPPPPPPTPSGLLLAAAAAAPRLAPRGRCARVRSCAGRGDERGVRTSPRAPSTFPPSPPSLSPGRHPRRPWLPRARSKSEAALGSAGPAPASHWAQRARGWGQRASGGEEGAGPGRAGTRRGPGVSPHHRSAGERGRTGPGGPRWTPLSPPQVPAPGRAPEPAWRGPEFDHLGLKKDVAASPRLTFSFAWSSELLFWVETELPIQPDRGAQDCGRHVHPERDDPPSTFPHCRLGIRAQAGV